MHLKRELKDDEGTHDDRLWALALDASKKRIESSPFLPPPGFMFCFLDASKKRIESA